MAVPKLPYFLRLVLVLGSLATHTFAQHDMAEHGMAEKKIVRGSDRPDLIPDEEAARLVFASIANHPPQIEMVHMDRADSKVATQVIVNYQKAFQKLLDGQPKSGPYDPAAQKRFITQANLLIKITKSELSDKLSADGYESILAYVQDQKQNMNIVTETMGGSN